jgi:hypothetical protein
MKKQDAGMNLRSHSLDKLRQIITTGASAFPLKTENTIGTRHQ